MTRRLTRTEDGKNHAGAPSAPAWFFSGGSGASAGAASFWVRGLHKEGKGAGAHDLVPGVPDDDLDHGQLPAQLFGRGLTEQVPIGGAQELHGAGAGDAVAPHGAGAGAAHRVCQGGHGAAVDHAVGVDGVGTGVEDAPGQAGFHIGQLDAVLIGELMGGVEAGKSGVKQVVGRWIHR